MVGDGGWCSTLGDRWGESCGKSGGSGRERTRRGLDPLRVDTDSRWGLGVVGCGPTPRGPSGEVGSTAPGHLYSTCDTQDGRSGVRCDPGLLRTDLGGDSQEIVHGQGGRVLGGLTRPGRAVDQGCDSVETLRYSSRPGPGPGTPGTSRLPDPTRPQRTWSGLNEKNFRQRGEPEGPSGDRGVGGPEYSLPRRTQDWGRTKSPGGTSHYCELGFIS